MVMSTSGSVKTGRSSDARGDGMATGRTEYQAWRADPSSALELSSGITVWCAVLEMAAMIIQLDRLIGGRGARREWLMGHPVG